MKVCYDREKDIVSIYFEEDFQEINNKDLLSKEENASESSNVYNSEKAANLILDTVDITSNGKAVGFRVFNATKYYDSELLSAADEESLDIDEIDNRPSEKVIATVTKEGVLN